MIVEYIWMDDKPVAAVFPNNRIVYLITDWQNKPRLGIDAVTKRNVWQWNPKAFGWPNASSNDYAITINLRFPGQYYDEQSGLYYNHNRYYNPQLGRYMEPDPIGLEGGLNPYAYAGNNPVNNTDASGLLDFLSEQMLSQTYADNSRNFINTPLPKIDNMYYDTGTYCKTDSFLSNASVTTPQQSHFTMRNFSNTATSLSNKANYLATLSATTGKGVGFLPELGAANAIWGMMGVWTHPDYTIPEKAVNTLPVISGFGMDKYAKSIKLPSGTDVYGDRARTLLSNYQEAMSGWMIDLYRDKDKK